MTLLDTSVLTLATADPRRFRTYFPSIPLTTP